jgi:DNA-binding SARP family transcriptional activator
MNVQCFLELKVSSVSGHINGWKHRTAKLLFEYLISKSGAPVTRESLMELLWPCQPPKSSLANLKVAIYHLRETLKPLFTNNINPIVYREGRYLINTEIKVTIDFLEFESRWKMAKALEKEGKLAEAKSEFESAERLYTGDFLGDELYEDWTIPTREALKDLYMLTLDKLADFAIGSADYETAISICNKILVKDSCKEDAYRKIMLCYYRLGQTHKALRCFENCRQVINIELGVDVSHETQAICEKIKTGQPI